MNMAGYLSPLTRSRGRREAPRSRDKADAGKARESKPHFWLSDFPHKQGTQEDPGTSQSRRL
jgi:hypothetical protein